MDSAAATVVDAASPRQPGKTRIVCMSDTHGAIHFPFDIPVGDIFIHAGDLTRNSQFDDFKRTIDWIQQLPHRFKLVIGGNHDHVLDSTFSTRGSTREQILAMFKEAGIVYLQHETYQLPASLGGYKVFASPYAPAHLCGAFMPLRGETSKLETLWKDIPNDTDILITHTPPKDILDKVRNGRHVGCPHLRGRIDTIQPIVSIFGHIHESYGHTTVGHTLFVNACTCNSGYRAKQTPIVFDLDQATGSKGDRYSVH